MRARNCLMAIAIGTVVIFGPDDAAFAAPTTGSWRQAGFGAAGNFLSVHFDAGQSGVVYACSDVAGVFRSTDSGDTWEMRSIGLGNYEVASFAVDPFDSQTLYAGCGAFASSNKAGIHVSRDAGATWQHLAGTFTNGITFRKYRTADAIAPHPGQQGVLVSGSRANGIWRSTDGGSSWTQVYAPPPTNAPHLMASDDDQPAPYPAPVSIVVFDPANASVAYAGLDGFGVVKSTDGGVSWQPINAGLPAEAPVKYLAVGSGGVVYAAVATAGVYRSTNGGGQWQATTGSLPSFNARTWVSSVAVHPSNPDTAYLSMVTDDFHIVWKTTNGGTTWSPKGDDPNTGGPDTVTYDPVNDPTETWAAAPALTWHVALDPHNPNRVFFVDFWGIFRSGDAGENWASKIRGAQNTVATQLVAETDRGPGRPDRLWATHMDAGLLSSTDRGATWNMVLPLTWDDAVTGHYWRFAIARVAGGKYYYATSDPWSRTYGQVFRSTDATTWTSVFTNARPTGAWMGGAMVGLAVDPSQPSTVYVTQDGGQVFKTTDNGDNWAPTTGQPAGNSFTFALEVDNAGRVFAGTLLDGLYRSADGGGSWQQVLAGQSTIHDLLAVPGAVYASCGDGNLYRSADGADPWTRVTDFTLVDDGDGVGEEGAAILVDPSDSNHLFFSRSDAWHPADAGAGVVESTDGGNTWTPINTGLDQLNVHTLTMGSDGTVYAGTWGGGIWRRLSAGSTRARQWLGYE